MPVSRANAEVEVIPVAAVCDRRKVSCSSSAVTDRRYRSGPSSAFTLIELLVVIAIIAVLAGLAFPVFQSVQNSAKKAQAKNDVTQIVTAVNAFYTEYGKYPLPPSAASDAAATFGPSNSNKALFDELRGLSNTLNTRQIIFLSPPDAKDANNPRAGIAGTSSPKAGEYFDPWGTAYFASIDWDYDNEVVNPYGADKGAGPAKIRQGVLSWSLGKNGALGGGAAASGNFGSENGTAGTYTSSGDVISWQ